MLDFLNQKYIDALSYLNEKYLYEMRLRAGKPVVVNYKGKYSYLCERGLSETATGSLTAACAELEEIVFRASEFSVYSVTEQLRQGFLTGNLGERIGLAGAFVYEDGKTFTVKEITSLNIRIPHEVLGCADTVYARCLQNGLQNILLISAPGRGKTTILRDLPADLPKTDRQRAHQRRAQRDRRRLARLYARYGGVLRRGPLFL